MKLNNINIYFVLMAFLSCILLASCNSESDDDYISKFKEGPLEYIGPPVILNGKRNFHTWNQLPSGYVASQVGYFKLRGRVMAIFENQPEDFKYSDAVPYSIVVSWKEYADNNALRNVDAVKVGRSFKLEKIESGNIENIPCYKKVDIFPSLVNNSVAILNVIQPNEEYMKFFDKIGDLKKGDFIAFHGRAHDLKKEGDDYDSALKSISTLHGREAFGPDQPILMQIYGLKKINGRYLETTDEKLCNY